MCLYVAQKLCELSVVRFSAVSFEFFFVFLLLIYSAIVYML
jgi:hypothetical protein